MSAAVSVDDPADGENAFLSSLQQGGETGGPDDAARFQRMVEANGASGNSIATFPPSAMLEQLGNGFVSFPQGWVGGMIQAAMMSGAFGDGQKHHAEIRNQQVAAILYAALHDLAATYQLMRWLIINVLPKDRAFVAGRLAGSFFYHVGQRYQPTSDERAEDCGQRLQLCRRVIRVGDTCHSEGRPHARFDPSSCHDWAV